MCVYIYIYIYGWVALDLISSTFLIMPRYRSILFSTLTYTYPGLHFKKCEYRVHAVSASRFALCDEGAGGHALGPRRRVVRRRICVLPGETTTSPGMVLRVVTWELE